MGSKREWRVGREGKRVFQQKSYKVRSELMITTFSTAILGSVCGEEREKRRGGKSIPSREKNVFL